METSVLQILKHAWRGSIFKMNEFIINVNVHQIQEVTSTMANKQMASVDGAVGTKYV